MRIEVLIPANSDAVWAVLTDWSNAHQWMPGIDSMEALGETAAGTELVFHARGKSRPSQILSCEPGQAIVLRSTQGGVTADYRYELHPVGESTKVTLVAVCTTNGLLWGALGPMIRMAMRVADRGQLEGLKKFILAG